MQDFVENLESLFQSRWGIRGRVAVHTAAFFNRMAPATRTLATLAAERQLSGQGDADLVTVMAELNELVKLVCGNRLRLLGHCWVDRQACLRQLEQVRVAWQETGVAMNRVSRHAALSGGRASWAQEVNDFSVVFGAGLVVCASMGPVLMFVNRLPLATWLFPVLLYFAPRRLVKVHTIAVSRGGRIILAAIGYAAMVGVLGTVAWGLFGQ